MELFEEIVFEVVTIDTGDVVTNSGNVQLPTIGV